MAEKAVNAADYYKEHATDEREYLRVYVARPVKEGDRMTVTSPLPMITRADEEGYEVSAYTSMSGSEKFFMSAEEFKEKMQDATIYAAADAAEDLPADVKVKPAAKGKLIVSNNGGIPVQSKAPYDGVIVEAGDNRLYLSNYELTSIFNYAGKKESTHPELLVRLKDEPPVKGIVLREDVTFAFLDGDAKATAGSLLMPNPDDKDGYTSVGGVAYARVGLRLNALANPSMTLDSDVKVSSPLHLKRKP